MVIGSDWISQRDALLSPHLDERERLLFAAAEVGSPL
jgi:hypothetical protein